MTVILDNPFLPVRWEHHGNEHPLIWFSETAEKISQDKSTYVAGTRGTGKTTLLKSICWKDLLENPSLNYQKTLGDMDHLGIYIRFPEHISSSLGHIDWQELFPGLSENELEEQYFFSLAVEATCIAHVLEAIVALRIAEKIKLSAISEIEICKTLIRKFPKLDNFCDQSPRSFQNIRDLLKNLVRRMNEASRRGTLSHLLSYLPKREPLELLNEATILLNKKCKTMYFNDRDNKLLFKFCLDDCEVLNVSQRKTINSMVRNSKQPVSWVICSVGDAVADSETFHLNQKVDADDRNVIVLNERKDREFEEFCTVVMNMRIELAKKGTLKGLALNQKGTEQLISIEKKFGTTRINDIINEMVNGSKKEEAHYIKSAANLVQKKRYNIETSQNKKTGKRKVLTPPYYEAYILMLWFEKRESYSQVITKSDLDSLDKRVKKLSDQKFHDTVRRKNVAAMLQIARRLKVRSIPFFGKNAIISMADGSIRDFLEILAFIFEEHKKDCLKKNSESCYTKILSQFSQPNRKIKNDVQAVGLNAASKAFYDGMGLRTLAEEDRVLKLVEFLGKYTKHLQSDPKSLQPLKSCERGIFTLDFSRRERLDQTAEDIDEVRELLWHAEMSGYLRRVDKTPSNMPTHLAAPDKSGTIVSYRLHKRFSPKFMFSYRGGLEGVQLDVDGIAAMSGLYGNSLSFSQWLRKQPKNVELSGIQLRLDLV